MRAAAPIRINMWSGPRTISTTMMRAFENRPDTAVIDEPFYGFYLARTGAEHPMRTAILESLPQTWNGVMALLTAPPQNGASILFHKHIAYHIDDDPPVPLDWLADQYTFLLIRDPKAMLASFAKKYDNATPVIRSLDVQIRIKTYLQEKGLACPVVDAADILQAPEAMLKALCAALSIRFDAHMLSWPPGSRSSDGVWAPHWYDAVMQSTGFKPPSAQPPGPLPDDLDRLAEQCMPNYRILHKERLTAGPDGGS